MNAVAKPVVATLANAALLLVLAGLALALLAWQGEGLRIEPAPGSRLGWAAVATAAWLLLLGWSRPARHQVNMATLRRVDADAEVVWLLVHASQTGYAEQLAWQSAKALDAAGIAVRVLPLAALGAARLQATSRLLIVASTTGEGDAPDAVAGFLRDVMDEPLALDGLRYGLLALGDSKYAHFCGFGHALHDWFARQGASALFDPIEVDNGDADALRRWQWQLGVSTGISDIPDWQAPDWRPWRLTGRRLLNADCAGNACFHLALRAVDPADAVWEAGDIAEIGPRQSTDTVQDWLRRCGLDGAIDVDGRRGREALAGVLARSHLPDATTLAGVDAQALADQLRELPHREYSIASLPADGELQLLVRQMRDPKGRLGIGSGWLAVHAPLGSVLDLRVRPNRNFHLSGDARPLILIGNGTGIAGLRALLKARIEAGHRDNWLLFGERHAAHDNYYGDELERWLAADWLSHLDLAFSRDPPRRAYVQDRLRESPQRLRDWVAAGASIHVCGSQQGMAEGVHQALVDLLGAATVRKVATDGRYRRDVY